VQLMHQRLIPYEKWRWYLSDVLVPIAAAVGVALLAQVFQPAAYQSRLAWVIFLLTVGVAALAASTLSASRIRVQLLGAVTRSLHWRYS
jgi:hypothetical protein